MSTYPIYLASFLSTSSLHFLLASGVAIAGSSVAPRNKIGHPARRYKRLMQALVLEECEPKIGSKIWQGRRICFTVFKGKKTKLARAELTKQNRTTAGVQEVLEFK